MNKKRFVISLLFSITILFVISSSTALADHTLDPTPDQLHKSSEFKGLMGNVKYLYDRNFISESNVKSIDSLLAHDLIFCIRESEIKEYGLVKTEFASKELAQNYRNKQVDIFGANYYVDCYFSGKEKGNEEDNGKTCMYGGVTNYEGNHLDNHKSQTIYVKVFENSKHIITFEIQADKKLVTAQELDAKARKFLIDKLNLYEFKGSPYETGYIKFIENDDKSFWYDLMPPPGNNFNQSKYLTMYSDNKTVESKDIKIEVHLTKK
ncbi:TPA: exotoxin [Staphylococcus pseudintermedius]|uniref:exotoxin beta-grasp domain-containing protein n=1 Tax=Staphylococcus pseudintermedius TaxID=283734 RepID=UPI000C71273D|nr:exotoxin OB-fold domain-containing protein [Staphylococcus pseudintermedius]EGQ2909807.1 exotoxin [Staphylococcus pseudintermedius]EGQ3554763.1 exotoxin [Staphylococcus pseudintermedius]EGQ3685928.1 exotoxin [Staphylococcus pseudintermedius]EGQ3794525.1 exotoxin [Staphylococcus pseudintermedius]EGQ4044285.1 exotoxin [Staphylococcus pseudintermedius]